MFYIKFSDGQILKDGYKDMTTAFAVASYTALIVEALTGTEQFYKIIFIP